MGVRVYDEGFSFCVCGILDLCEGFTYTIKFNIRLLLLYFYQIQSIIDSHWKKSEKLHKPVSYFRSIYMYHVCEDVNVRQYTYQHLY